MHRIPFKFIIGNCRNMQCYWRSSLCIIAIISTLCSTASSTNLPPSFTHDMNNLVLSENTPVGEVVFKLEGTDPENSSIHFGLTGIDLLKVDPTTGEVTVVKPLDHEANDTLNFFVTIEDEVKDAPVGGNNIVEVPVTVIVLDENDNVPIFKNVPYTVFVEEDTPINTTVFSDVIVTDADTVGDAIEVECINLPNFLDACDIFGITTINSAQSSYQGGLILKQKLNFRLRKEHQFLLRAMDGELNSTTIVNIKVGDVQNTPPEFTGSLHAEISEDAPINTLVLTVHAEDGDQGMPRKIVYELIENPMNYFLIDAITGEIRTARPLDKEAVDNPLGLLNLNIRAKEVVNGTKGNDPLTVTNAEVTVIIKDVNDEPPSFNNNEYYVEISEDIVSGEALPNLNMTVTDPDVGNNSVFSLTLDDILHSFTIEPEVVVGSSPVTIRIANSSLDYEDPNQRKFIILVIAKEIYTNPQLSSTATITVTVTDANDNAPTFDLHSYTAVVSEMAAPGTLVQTIVAKDRDSGKFGENGIIYQLVGSGSEKFTVNNRTGAVTVSDCNGVGNMDCLDYETKHEYFLSFKATDDDGKGQSTVVPLTIILADSNDNPPKFNQPVYNVFVLEGAVKFEPELMIEAEDLDKTSHVTYSIIAGNTNDVFNIDPNTGKMRIASNKVITFNDDANKNNIILNVEATDGKYTASTIVNITVIDVNDHNPVFDKENYSVSVAEDVKIGSSVFEVKATDADTGVNAEISYSIRKGSFNDFAIDAVTGIITVSSKLDYDRRNTYNLEVAAMDQGSVSLTGTTIVTIHIVNTNDKPPYFAPTIQKAEVMKDAKVGTVIYTLIAIDPDITSSEALNFAATEPITAIDKYGQVVDNAMYKDFFAVDKNTGKVSVLNALQRDIAAIIKITVLVTDITAPTVQQGEGTLIITIIDINDRPPIFVPPWTSEKPIYALQLEEELPVGTIIATYTAVDQDSVIAGYYIKPGSKYFEINNGTGILQIKEQIDYEKTKSLNFTIVAYDSGTPQLNASAVVYVTVVNINDNVPIFSAKIYNATVDENSSNGTHIITVNATDQDADEFGHVTYSLTGEHSENFVVLPESGEIFVANPLFLDHEVLNETTIQVVATDSAPGNLKHSISVPVYISILDVNDNAPKFNQSSYNATVSENIRFNPPFLIMQLFATDADEGINGNINYKIIAGNQDDIFLLGEDTGILYAHKSLLGKTYDFILEVEARDGAGKGKFTDKTVVNIHVVNVNEHKPTFIVPALPNTTVEVTENAVPDYLVMTVKAIDKDIGQNGRITYHLKVNGINLQETPEFIIYENTGELKTKVYLDREIKAKYEVTLVARDHGLPVWYETVHYLTVLLVNSNDEAEFPNSKKANPYHFYVTENSKKNMLIGQVKAFGAKQDKSAKVYYYLLSGAEDNAFYINKLDGSLYTNKVFDREEIDEYDLLVLANNEPDFYLTTKEQNRILYNETAHGSSIAKVKVTINDLNDNPPRFEKPAYYAAMNSMADVNSFVANLSATDPDFGINGSLTYYVKSSSLYKYGSSKSSGSVIPSPFNITEDGQLFTATLLTENNQHRFIVDITAREAAYPEREGSAKVYVWIFEPEQLIRVILSRPADEVVQEKDEIISELSNATKYLIVNDEIKDHVDKNGHQNKEWSDMYILAVDPSTQTIMNVYDILKIIDAKYDFLKDYYAGFAIENVVPAFAVETEESFDPALSALIALLLVLLVGILTFTVVCCCLRNWMISPSDLKKKDALINKAVIDELNTTENPLWIEQKLKIYEEQELTMQVFNEPEQAILDRRNSGEFIPDDNTYATIQHPNRRGSAHTATLSLVDDMADYATLSRLPHNSDSSHSSLKDTVNYYEAAMGFQGSTFQVPESSRGDLGSSDEYIPHRHGSELTLNNDGQLEYVAELI